MAIAGFNESYYLQTNKDVLTAYLQGKTTAEEHFLKFGANELRNPNANFDSTYYAANNPDVVAAVKAGIYANVYDHYIKNGGKEGRVPSAALANFNGQAYLDANADLKTAGYTAANVLAHYVLYGAAENRAGGTAQQVTGNYVGTTADDTVTPAGGQASTVRVEGGQQGAKGDTLVITSGSAASFQLLDLSNNADQNQTRDNSTNNNQGNKIGPVVQGFENVDATAATINMDIAALDRTSITNTGSVASTITGSVILGGTGRDTLRGGAGNDSLVGGDGNDVLGQVTINGVTFGNGAGNDTISGGAGNDIIGGGAGADVLSDGAGDDTVNGDAGADIINVDGGTNFIDGGADNDTITLKADQATATTVSTIQGGSGNDTIVLNDAAITAASRVSVTGGVGNDTIIAGLGVETINGGAGNDTIRLSQANIGTGDVFNGNDGQDILQLEIPTGSGTNTYTFAPTTAGQFSGFEAIALIDSSTNANAKSYKLILTDNFVANNLVNGSFLIDARGLPGGSNVVLDFSQLTAASAAVFTATNFRILASPSTDVRDQNNNTITSTYLTNTSNAALSAVAAFTVYAGETSIVAGSDTAYTADRLVSTGTGQAAYTTVGGSVETTQNTGSSFDFIINAQGATLTNSFNSNTITSTQITGSGTLNANSNSISVPSGANLGTATIVDITPGDGDRLDATLVSAVTPTAISGIETINLSSYAAGGIDLSKISGATSINVTGQSFVGSNIANGQSLNLNNISTGGAVTVTPAATIAAATLNLNNVVTSLVSGTAAAQITTLNLVAIGANTLAIGADAINGNNSGILAISGSGSLTINDSDTSAAANTTTINAASLTGSLTYNQLAAAGTGPYTVAVTGGSGNDAFNFNTTGTLTAADTIIGGAGTDTLTTSGWTATNDLANVTGIEVINLTGSSVSYSYTTSNPLVAFGQTLTVNAASASGSSSLVWNGAVEDNGLFNITGTSNSDTLTGGSGNDTLNGGAGNDTLNFAITATAGGDVLIGGTGNDTFAMVNGTATGIGGRTTINDFASGDVLQLDISTIQALQVNGANALANLRTGAGNANVTAGNLTITQITADNQAVTGGSILFLSGKTYADLAAARADVLTAGDRTFTVANNTTQYDGFLVAYQGTDGGVHIAAFQDVTGGATSSNAFTSAVELVNLVGVSAATFTALAAGSFTAVA